MKVMISLSSGSAEIILYIFSIFFVFVSLLPSATHSEYKAPKVDAKNDRAEQRRQKVGSSCDHEKTKAASLHTSISTENKGFRMLKNLGWSEGQTLGKNQDGLLEPVNHENYFPMAFD